MTTSTITGNVCASKRVRVEREWEYVSVMGNFLGYWKNVRADRIGGEINLVVNPNVGDRLFLNGKEIEIPPYSHDLLKIQDSQKEIIKNR